MENVGGKFRKKKSFSMVSNTIIRDEKISLKAKGLYSLIQSYISLENFTLYKWYLQSKCSEGQRAFNSAWQELKTTGYLKVYRVQDPNTKQICWEYELLDEPYIQNDSMVSSSEPYIQNVYNGSCIRWKMHHMHISSLEKCRHINNILFINTISNNNLFNQSIISMEDVIDMIGLDTLDLNNTQVKEIVMLITEILNMADSENIRISGNLISVSLVKERYHQINRFHIQYVIDCMKKNKKKIGNIKSYLLTSLYNAPTTISSYYQNRVAVDLY